ncbi:MAG: AAA family ATPase, partial [Candidatus Kariarchaeaceae archaeon]
EQRIVRMFKNAREYSEETGQQAVIFIDEAEAILPKRGSRRSSDVDTTIVPTFLSEMDGFAEHNPFIILSTNIPDNLDDAVLREGRIDIKVPIMRPSKEDSKEIFAIHFNGIACHDTVEELCEYAAEKLYTCDLKKRVSGAMIKTIVNVAARAAMKRVVVSPKTKKVGVAKEDIVKSLILINHGTDQ